MDRPGNEGDYEFSSHASWRESHMPILPKVVMKYYADRVVDHVRREVSGLLQWLRAIRPKGFWGWTHLTGLNVFSALVIFTVGVISFESSTPELRDSLGTTVLFPISLTNAVALPLTTFSEAPFFIGNFLGFYVVRVYSAWRGRYLVSVGRGGVLFAASVINAVEVSVAAFLLRRFLCTRTRRKHVSIDCISDARLYFVVVFWTSLFFHTIIAVVIVASPLVQWRDFFDYFGTRWMSTLAGRLSVTPAVMHLMVWRPRPSLFGPRKVCEALVLWSVTIALVVIIFITDLQAVVHPLPYLLFPIIILSAFRFNRLGAALVVFVMAFVCCWASIRAKGAMYRMSGSPPVTSTKLILQVELFVSVLGSVGIMLAAAIREKKQLARDLRVMNEELEDTVGQRTQELVMANEELKESQRKAEEASQAKSDFLANMSHEIRTPIHGIMGLTALLLDSQLSADQRDSLASVKDCANLLLHIINSILDLAKIEAGKVDVEFVPFNVRQLVSSTIRVLATRALERQLDLLWEVDSNVPEWMVGDSGKVQQCLLNLVGNAVKFTHEGSVKVHVAVDVNYSTSGHGSSRQTLELDDHSKGLSPSFTPSTPSVLDQSVDSTAVNILDKPVPWENRPKENNGFSLWKLQNGTAYGHEPLFCVPIVVEVRDTGIGISKDKLRDIFRPFTQGDASTSRVYGGTGLGLCIVQRFVELLGGKLAADSELGKGSAFRFSIPLGVSDAQTTESNRVNSTDGLDSPRFSQPSPYTSGEAQLLDTTVRPSSILNNGGEERDATPTKVITRQDPVNIKEIIHSKDDGWSKSLHLHVLLAEDNIINQKVAVRQLQKHGHKVTVVGDGVGAVDAVRANHDGYDLVIMDIQMPNMDGLEASRRIRAEEAQQGWRRLPVLGLTAHAISGYEQTCLSCGMDGYLGKPFDINQLLRIMSKYLPVPER